MIEKLGAVIALIIGIFSFGYIKGGNNERNKRAKRAIKVVKEVKRRRKKRSTDSAATVKRRLRKNARDK